MTTSPSELEQLRETFRQEVLDELRATGGLWIEYRDLADLPAATRNARVHDLDAIAGVIRGLGFTRPGLLDERTGRLVAGHGRRLVLQRDLERGEPCPEGIRETPAGWSMPVVRGWSSRDDAHADAVALADNAVGQTGGFHDDVLLDILGDLAADAPDLLAATTYTSDDIDRLMESADAEQPTDLDRLAGPEPAADPFPEKERKEPAETSRDEQWESGSSPDEGNSREDPEGPGPLDVEPAWRTLEPLRARYHDGTPDGAETVARWLRTRAADVHVDHQLAVTWRGRDGTEYLPPGKWVTWFLSELKVRTREEMAATFVAANEPARRRDRDAKPVGTPEPAKATVPPAAELLRNGTGVLLGNVTADGLTVTLAADTLGP